MSLRFQLQSQVSALPDEQIDSAWECILPSINIIDPYASMKQSNGGIWDSIVSAGANLFSSYTPIVEEIVFGVTNFKTQTRRVRTMWCNVPEDIENYHDAAITFFVSAGMLTQYYLSAWRSLVYNAEGEYYYPMSVYKKNIEVYLYGPGNIGIEGLATAHFTLHGCFPATQTPYQLQYKENPQRLRIQANFKVDKVTYEFGAAKTSIAQELITSPTSLVDRAVTSLSGLMGGSNEYSVENTYGYE